ncbi:MAG: response regulator [Polyangiaceae bacterium]
MNERRAALVARFRVGSIERARSAISVLSASEAPGAAAMRVLLGDLHTLKGEAGMLGFASLSELTHVIEGRLSVVRSSWPPPGHEAVLAALDAIVLHVPGELGPGTIADAAFVAALADLSSAPEPEPAPEPQGPSSDAAPSARGGPPSSEEPRSRPEVAPASGAAGVPAPSAVDPGYAIVRAAPIEALCERIDMLRASFGLLGAALGADASGAVVDALARVRLDLDDVTMRAWSFRLAPVEPFLSPLADHARRLARGMGKPLRVVVEAARTELERSVLAVLEEPLLHIVQNAVDHGIEPPGERGDKPREAQVTIRAAALPGSVAITIQDDGRGIDTEAVVRAAVRSGRITPAAAAELGEHEALDLVFDHGLSTREAVSEVSGRGVGLDVVRARVEALGGTVELASSRGKGSTFTVRLPTKVWRERVLVIESGGVLFGFPARLVLRVVDAGDVADTAVGPRLVFDGAPLPVVSFSALVGAQVEAEPKALVLDVGGRLQAIRVERHHGEVDLVRRPADRLLGLFRVLQGSATLDDGRLVLLVQAAELARESARVSGARPVRRKVEAARKLALVVDDSLVVRTLVAELLTGLGLEVEMASSGVEALSRVGRRVPDIVLSDVEMPEMDGFELLGKLRETHPHLPVIMVTTRGSLADRQKAAMLGADAYLVKTDFHSRELAETVRRFVGPA